MDGDKKILALKFGIAVNYQSRVVKQNNNSIYQVVNYGVWEYPTILQCTQAERDCKVQLKCGILSKQEMMDGHSETVYPLNLEDIMDIYERHGGVRVI
jgi:hypothetical protein